MAVNCRENGYIHFQGKGYDHLNSFLFIVIMITGRFGTDS
jgi:hypothetical protein